MIGGLVAGSEYLSLCILRSVTARRSTNVRNSSVDGGVSIFWVYNFHVAQPGWCKEGTVVHAPVNHDGWIVVCELCEQCERLEFYKLGIFRNETSWEIGTAEWENCVKY